MRTEQILYLDAIFRCSSLHKASEILHISTQALSLSIRTLEKELGFTILERSRTGVSLTDKGQQLLKIGVQFLHQIEQLQEIPLQKYGSILQGSLKIMGTNGIFETFFPPLISQLLSEYPGFELKLMPCDLTEMCSILDHEPDIELSFIYQPSIDNQPLSLYDPSQFSFSPLLSGIYYCIIPESFSIAHYKTISLSTMAKYPIILFTPMSTILLRLFSNVRTKKIIFADSLAIYKQFLKDGIGLGITFMPNDSNTPILTSPNLKFIPFKEQIHCSIGYLHKKNSDLTPLASAFIEYLTDYLNKTPPADLLIF